MKKLLSLLGSISIIVTSSVAVVSCGESNAIKPEITDDEKLVKKLEQDVNNIFAEHLQNSVYKNMIGLTAIEENNKFLNKSTIKVFKDKSAQEIGEKNLSPLVEDIKRILDLNQLELELNKLKLVNEYKILLESIDSLYKNIIFDWDTLEIATNEQDLLYLANVILDFKIQIQYKGKKEIAIMEISDSFKYTLTNDATLKNSSDNFYRNISKEYFSSQNEEDKKYSNLLWNNIKGSKNKIDGYGNVEKEIDNYWSEIAPVNGFSNSLINFIKNTYFSELSNLPLSFKDSNFYKSSTMNETSLFRSINKIKSYNDSSSIKFDYKTKEGQLMLESIFRKNPDNYPTSFILKDNYFTEKNLNIWKKDYEMLKEDFIKNLKADLNDFKDTNQYKNSFSMGYANLTGLSINFPDDSYIHKLPDFKIAFNFIIDLEQTSEKLLEEMTEFSINSIKAFHEVFGVDYDFKYSEYNNSKDDILMAIKKSNFTDALEFSQASYGGVEKINPALLLINNKQKEFRNRIFELAKLPLNTKYNFDFRYKSSIEENSNYGYSKYYRNYDKTKGIFFSYFDKNQSNNLINENLIYWNLGYLNFHFDLDQIIDFKNNTSIKQKDFIVFT